MVGSGDGDRIMRSNAVNEVPNQRAARESEPETEEDANAHQEHPLPDNQAEDSCSRRTQRNSNADSRVRCVTE